MTAQCATGGLVFAGCGFPDEECNHRTDNHQGYDKAITSEFLHGRRQSSSGDADVGKKANAGLCHNGQKHHYKINKRQFHSAVVSGSIISRHHEG